MINMQGSKKETLDPAATTPPSDQTAASSLLTLPNFLPHRWPPEPQAPTKPRKRGEHLSYEQDRPAL